MVRALLQAGQDQDARALLRQLTVLMPAADAPWLQLMTLEPALLDDQEFLKGFLRNHPRHHFARALGAHLQNLELAALLSAIQPTPAFEAAAIQPPQRLGDILISRGWTTPRHVEFALAEQRRLREAKVDQRLGTVMLMHGHVTSDQLAVALTPSVASGYSGLGSYLVRNDILTSSQVAKALARQAEIAAARDRIYLDALAAKRPGLLSRYLGSIAGAPRRQAAPKLGELLVSMGLLGVDDLRRVLHEQEQASAAR